MKKIKYILLLILLIGIDQISKIMIIKNKNILPQNIIGKMVRLNYCENTGVAFGIGKANIIITIVIIILVISISAIYIRKIKNKNMMIVGISMVLSGGFGNLFDRIFYGFVIDFIDVDLFKFPIFNFADICVVIGIIILGISYFIIEKGEKIENIKSRR